MNKPSLAYEIENSPKISVVMPSYNQIAFIEKSILSVLNQNYNNLEFIIIDGGSNDGTLDIIKKYEHQLTYWVSEPDQGQSDALNKGFERATGHIYGWMNSDDLYTPDAFKYVVDAFKHHPDKKIVFGDWLSIDSEDKVIHQEYAFDFNLNHFKYEGFHLNSQAMFWLSDVHHRFGVFDIKLHRTMDYQLIIAFGTNEGNCSFLRLRYILACFRRHPNQKTLMFDDKVLSEHKRIADNYGYSDKYKFIGKLKRIIYRARRALWYLKRGGFYYLVEKMLKK